MKLSRSKIIILGTTIWGALCLISTLISFTGIPLTSEAVGWVYVINGTSCTAIDQLGIGGSSPVSFEIFDCSGGGVSPGNIPPGGVGAVYVGYPYYSYQFVQFEAGEDSYTTTCVPMAGGDLVFTIAPCVACEGNPGGDSGDGDGSPIGSPPPGNPGAPEPGAPPGPGWPLGDSPGSSGSPADGGNSDGLGDAGSKGSEDTTSGSCSSAQGMPRWSVSEPYISLWLHDEPLGYQPALGPRISLRLAYKQREFSAGLAQNFFSVGRKWNFPWFSYVNQDASGNKVVHFGGGQQCTYYGTNAEYLTGTRLSGNTSSGFTISYSDGSQNVYGLLVTNSDGKFEQAFLTEIWNAQAQKTRLVYAAYTPSANPVIRLNYVIDGDGRTNTIYYAAATTFGANLISQVVDPFGRTNSFAYDDYGHLTNITDVAGLATSLLYDSHDWITNMTTPYGTTTFVITDSTGTVPNGRSILVTEPDGGNELFLYQDNASGISSSYSGGQVPSSSPFANTFENTALNARNTFHWGRRQYTALSTNVISAFTSADFRKARMKHWLTNDTTTVDATISLQRDPSSDSAGSAEGQKSWYDYAGKTNSSYPGTQILPLCVARVRPDGTTRFVRTERNGLGLVTRSIETYETGSLYRTNIFTYASNGQDLITLTNAIGVQISSNAYNAYHQVLTNFNALLEMTVFTYNTNQQWTSLARPSGLITTNIFLTSGAGSNFLDRSIDYSISGGTTYYGSNVFTWANDLLSTKRDPRGNTVTNTWDNLRRLTSSADSRGSSRGSNLFTYVNLDLVKTVDPMGFVTSVSYDNVRRLTAETNAAGAITRYGYCTCGALSALTNAFGSSVQQVTVYSYDNQGHLTQMVGPDGYTQTFNYDLLSEITNSFDAISSVTNWFNNQGLLTSSSNAFGRILATGYDILDRMTNTVNADSVSLTNIFDNLNRLVSRRYPDGGVEQFVFTLNVAGVTSYTNQLGSNAFIYSYDPLGRKTSERCPGVTTNSFAYNTAGDLITLTDGRGQITTWNYDQFGRTTNKVDAMSTEILRYFYDSDDRLTNRWSKARGYTTYSLDSVGNITNISYPVSSAISKQYDLLNRLTRMVDAVGTTSYGYTSAGQLQTEDGPWPDDTVSYTYNNRLRSGFSVLAPNASPWTLNYSYDAARRLTSVTSLARTFSYIYDPARNLKIGSLTVPNGAFITNKYDTVARLLSTSLKSSSGSTINAHSYAFDLVGQRTFLTNTFGDYRGYAYDNFGQLTSTHANEPSGAVRSLEQLSYVYDAGGNLLWRTNNSLIQALTANALNELTGLTNSGTLTIAGTTTGGATNVTVWGTSLTAGPASIYSSDNTWARTNATLPNGSATYTASAQDNLGRTDTNMASVSLPNGVVYQYDPNGNLTNDSFRSFVYDDENQLISVVVTNGSGNVTRSDFAYDGLMRRRTRSELLWLGNAWVTNQVMRYVYDGDVVVQERDGNNLPVQSYTRGSDLSGQLNGAGGIGGLLARTDHSELIARLPAAHAYYHSDGNGNVTCLINTNQSVVAKYLYDPYGNILEKAGALSDANLYRFSSKETHIASGLVCYEYRVYDPGIQHWLNRDPVGEAGGLNLYQFDRNSPINYIDATGRAPQLTLVTFNRSTGQSTAGYTSYQFGQGYGIGFNGPLPESPFGALDKGWNSLWDQITPPIDPNTDPFWYAANQTARGAALTGILGAATGGLSSCSAADLNAFDLELSQTVANHLTDLTKAGDLARPYLDSRLLMQEIIDTKPPIPDPGGVPGGLRWDVPGEMNGTFGTYELVVDPNSGTVLHFVFKR